MRLNLILPKVEPNEFKGVSQKQISNLGMSRLIAFAGNNLSRGLNLADLMA